jgi:hypothetical protein
MPSEMAADLHRVRMEVEHRAHALDDVLEPRILREPEGEVEQVFAWHGADTEPSGVLVTANRAAICVVTYRLDARRRIGSEQCGEEHPIEWWSVSELQRDWATVDTSTAPAPLDVAPLGVC